MKNSTPHTNAIDPVRNSLNRWPWRRGLPRKQQLPRTQTMWVIRGILLIPLVFASFALAPTARAVDPPPDGGYPGGNTAEGTDALLLLGAGTFNTAVGYQALLSNTDGTDNTATGAYALYNNITGSYNAAHGSAALYSNTTGSSNTATGYASLYINISSNNTATGAYALYSNIDGSDNTATGLNALYSNTSGSFNTAHGSAALYNNTTGIWNTASGWGALNTNKDGSYNTADGLQALFSNTSGTYNTACGLNALFSNASGSNNTGLGSGAGGALTTGSDNIDIGHGGFAGESAKIRIGTKGTHKNTYIAGIYGVTAARGVGVFIDSNGHLGTTTSSERFKDAIKPMARASEAILALKPVTFHYKKELDPEGIPQFGLVAEQVAKVNPDLVARDDEGKPYTVRYEAVNAMLLNEFLKEHRKGQEKDSTIAQLKSAVAQQQKQIIALTETVQKVSEQLAAASPSRGGLEVNKATPQLVADNQ